MATIANRRQRTAKEIADANRAYMDTLSAIVIENVVEAVEGPKPKGKKSKGSGTTKSQDRRERRGIPYVGTGGIDVRRDPLLEVIDREHQRERDALIRSRRKAAVA